MNYWIYLRKQLASSEEGTNMQKKTIITCIKDHYIIVQSYTHHNKTQLDTFSSIKKAIKDSKKETAKNLLDMNLPVDRIAKATGLSIDEVNELIQ